MMRLIALLAVVALAGCDVAQQTADEIARDRAKSAVNGVVSERFPGVNAAPVTDCIIDNASAQEILVLARASITGLDEEAGRLVTDIAQRPDSIRCLASNALSLF